MVWGPISPFTSMVRGSSSLARAPSSGSSSILALPLFCLKTTVERVIQNDPWIRSFEWITDNKSLVKEEKSWLRFYSLGPKTADTGSVPGDGWKVPLFPWRVHLTGERRTDSQSSSFSVTQQFCFTDSAPQEKGRHALYAYEL